MEYCSRPRQSKKIEYPVKDFNTFMEQGFVFTDQERYVRKGKKDEGKSDYYTTCYIECENAVEPEEIRKGIASRLINK